MPASSVKGFTGPNRNDDPPLEAVVVDISSVDYTPPNNALMTALNCSVSGVIYLMDRHGVTAPEYMNTGWNPCTACKTVVKHASNTATVLKAKLVAN